MKFLIWLSGECVSLKEVVGALRGAGHEVGILLAQNGVYLADKGCPYVEEILGLGVTLFASREHAESRGVIDRMVTDVKLVDYSEMVDIVMEEYDRVITV